MATELPSSASGIQGSERLVLCLESAEQGWNTPALREIKDTDLTQSVVMPSHASLALPKWVKN